MNLKKHIGIYSICFFFFLMLVLPASFQAPRGILLIIILFFSLTTIKSSLFKYDKLLIHIGLVNVFFSLIFVLNGILRNAPGAINMSTVYIVWPILYLYFIGLSTKTTDIIPLLNTIIYGGLGSSILILLFIYNNFFGFPLDLTYIAKSQDFGFFWNSGVVELNSMNLATVLYTFVYVLTLLLIPSKLNQFRFNKNLTRLTLFLCLGLIFISSRRAFWLVCLISPFLILFLLKLVGVNLRLRRFLIPGLISFFILAIFVGFLALDNENIATEFNSSFEFDNPQAESNYIRNEQFKALMNGWGENLFLGNGLGSQAKGSIRDIDSPWNYELSYVALLFHTGIVGIVIYASSIFWIIFESINICRKKRKHIAFIMPLIAAMICFLLVNASNPYLGKFDYLWTIFLPIGYINAIKLEK
jgi:O-antigen ligase